MEIKILSELDIDKYLEYFKNLNSKNKEVEINKLVERITKKHNHYEFLLFLKIMDYIGIESEVDDLKTIDNLSDTIKELSGLSDFTLDNISSRGITNRQRNLLDSIHKTIVECEILYRYYNEKIIN